MGASYIRDESLPEALQLVQGETQTLSIPHIFDEFTTVTLDSINLRQSSASALPFITIFEESSQSMVRIDCTGVAVGDYDLHLESFDALSDGQATLKTDLIKVSVSPLKYLEFANDPESQSLLATESRSWVLPEIAEGGYPLQEIILVPDESLAPYITFDELTRTVFFNADSNGN